MITQTNRFSSKVGFSLITIAVVAILAMIATPATIFAITGSFTANQTVANVVGGADDTQAANYATTQANVSVGTDDQTFILANVTPSGNASIDNSQTLTALTTTANAGVKSFGESGGADGSTVTATTFGAGNDGLAVSITDDNLTDCASVTLGGSSIPYTIACDLDASVVPLSALTATALTSLIDGASDLTAVVKGTGSNPVVAHTITLAGGVAEVAQVTTFTPASGEVGDIFSIIINGTQYDFTATGATVQSIVEGLQPLVDAHGAVTCSEDDLKVTCTADSAGTAFTFSANTTNKPAVAQVDDVTPSNIEAGDTFTISGITTSPVAVVSSNTSASTLVDDLVTAINADVTNTTVTASNVSSKLRLTADSAGTSFTATPSTQNRSAVTQINTITIAGAVEVGDIFTATLPTVGAVNFTAISTSADDVATGLNSAIQGSAGYASQDFTSGVVTNVITLTAKVAGTGFTANSSATNKPAVAQEVTFTPSNIVDGETFRATINGGSNLDYTVTGTESVQDVVEGIVTTMDLEPGVSCSEDDTKVICTANSAGTSFTFSATVVDITAPTVVITDDEAGTANIAGGNILYTFTFSEAVTGFTVGEVVVVGGTPAVSFASGSDGSTVYTLVVTPDSNSVANITVDVAGSVATDAALNNNVAASQSVQAVDTQTPTITSITSNATAVGALKIGDTILFTLTPGATEDGASVTGSYNGASLTWNTADSGVTYTATYTVVSGETDRGTALQISGVTITDSAGNTSSSASGSDVVKTIDANVPTLVSARTNSITTIDVAFSEDLLGTTVTNSDFDVTGSTLTTPDATEITPGVVRLTLNTPIATDATPAVSYTGSVTDMAGNVAPTAGPVTPSDGIAPSVIISDDEAGVANIAGGVVEFTFTFSEAVTGFADTDVSVGGGSKGTFTADSGTVYRLEVTPAGASTANITVDVAGSVAVDTNGNDNTAATQAVQVVDTLRPTLSVVTIASDNASTTRAKVGDEITLSITSSESVGTPTVTIDGNSASVSGATTNWTATYTMQSGDTEGTLPFTVDFTDLNTNAGIQVTALTSGNGVIFDRTKPVIGLVGDSPEDVAFKSTFTDKGATSTDNIDGTLTSSVVTVNPVDTAIMGLYTVTYNVTDSAGNQATEVTRSVEVKRFTVYGSGGGGNNDSDDEFPEAINTQLVLQTLTFEIPPGATNDEVVAILKTHLVSLLTQLVLQLQIELNSVQSQQ